MPRLRQVSRADATSDVVIGIYDFIFGDRDPVEDPGTDTGTPGDWWTVFALVPDVLKHAIQGFALYRSPARQLDPVLRELGQCRAGWSIASQFVYSQHCKSLRTLGVAEAKIAAVSAWQTSDQFDEIERAVLAYADALALDRGRVADGVFETLKRHLNDEAILELTYITTMYIMHGIMSNALRTEFDNVPERLTEVPGAHESLAVPEQSPK
jgi:alkylhydroperoxidase family enzyme